MNVFLRWHAGILFCALALSACSGSSDNGGQALSNATQTGVDILDIPPAQSANAQSATFQDLAGRPVELADFKGRRVLLNYWATWCAPCIKELPSLARAAEILGPEGYVVLLASDESVGAISAFIAENGFNGNFVKLNQYFSAQGVQAVPSTILYDEQGRLLNSWLGANEWDSPQMLAELRAGAPQQESE